MSRRVLTVAAHPDDEILGCGGTMARHIAEGDQVRVLILAEGLTSRDLSRDLHSRKDALAELGNGARKACAVLGVQDCQVEGFPDNRMDGVDLLDVVKRIEREVDEFRPGVVYTHFSGDLNVDHSIVSRAVATACRPVPGNSVQELYLFEVNSSTEWQIAGCDQPFQPNSFVSLIEGGHDFLEKKIDALRVYESEMRAFPHSRSLEAVRALATWRGASVGLSAAESFMMVRSIR